MSAVASTSAHLLSLLEPRVPGWRGSAGAPPSSRWAKSFIAGLERKTTKNNHSVSHPPTGNVVFPVGFTCMFLDCAGWRTQREPMQTWFSLTDCSLTTFWLRGGSDKQCSTATSAQDEKHQSLVTYMRKSPLTSAAGGSKRGAAGGRAHCVHSLVSPRRRACWRCGGSDCGRL